MRIGSSPSRPRRPAQGDREDHEQNRRRQAQGLHVDLRNNRGGRLDQSMLVSDAFLDRGKIVSTRSRNAEETRSSTPSRAT
jgi:C-terminal processing protease CtpA/Prc